MEDIKQLLKKYEELKNNIKKENDISIKQELENNLIQIETSIKEHLKKELENGNASPEFIQIHGQFDSTITMESASKDKDDIKTEKEQYSLASTKIVSSYNGEEIDLSNMTRIEKIKTIYDHTGVELNYEDPEIIKLCELRCEQFLRGCIPSIYEQRYGENWKEEISKIYKQSYLQTVQRCITNGLNEIDEKNRKRKEQLNGTYTSTEEEIKNIENDINSIKEETSELQEEATRINSKMQEYAEREKEEIGYYWDGTTGPLNQYRDGTIMPDNLEPGRFTTYRNNRENETGMQERINDSAHVHEKLSEQERESYQQKYEEVFGATLQEETPSKTESQEMKEQLEEYKSTIVNFKDYLSRNSEENINEEPPKVM